MRINPKDTLFDQPILKIRAVVRDAMMERLKSISKDYIYERVAMLLKQPKPIARKIIKQLVKEGYLVLQKVNYINVFQYELTETEKGRRFGVATANPAISRQKAEQLLNDLIERAKHVNDTKKLVYFVESIKVFGSFLSQKEILGDLDVAVKLTRKCEADKFMKVSQQRIQLAINKGRRFSNYIEEIFWPHREVMLLLKARQKGLSLHDEESDEVINKTKSKIVYEFKPAKTYFDTDS